MKGTLYLRFDDEITETRYNFQNGTGGETYSIEINTNSNTPFSEILIDNKNFRHSMELFLDSLTNFFSEDNEIYYKKLISLINNHKDGNINLLSNIEFISIETDEELIVKYIEKNPILKTQKIILPKIHKLDLSDLEETKNKFSKYIDNIYIYLEGNGTPISISESEKTVKAIDAIVDTIKKFNFSPLEQLMYVYDLTRDRIYTDEDSVNDSCLVSRDLTAALFGDKIVCAGFAKIFNVILKKLNIKSAYYNLVPNGKLSSGHVRNMVYVEDPKYNVRGVYLFDPTWDSKQKDGDNNFLKSYRFFAKTRTEIQEYDDIKGLIDGTLPMYNESMIWEFEEILDEQGIKKVSPKMIRTINTISKFIDGIDLINPAFAKTFGPKPDIEIDKKYVMAKLWDYTELLENHINGEVLLKVLYNVRSVQDPQKYPSTLEDYCLTSFISKWRLKGVRTKADLIKVVNTCLKQVALNHSTTKKQGKKII